ncbi:hypothetical protein [Oleidesulfovibrio sp.]|uniref:hypothetical protein n=1 Tax=Oleidesulfovibrio sp. TaxID=2909707 RepID=UPI003A8B9AF5
MTGRIKHGGFSFRIIFLQKNGSFVREKAVQFAGLLQYGVNFVRTRFCGCVDGFPDSVNIDKVAAFSGYSSILLK